MQATYQKAKSEILTLWQLDRELSGLLTLNLFVVVAAIGMGLGVMA